MVKIGAGLAVRLSGSAEEVGHRGAAQAVVAVASAPARRRRGVCVCMMSSLSWESTGEVLDKGHPGVLVER